MPGAQLGELGGFELGGGGGELGGVDGGGDEGALGELGVLGLDGADGDDGALPLVAGVVDGADDVVVPFETVICCLAGNGTAGLCAR